MEGTKLSQMEGDGCFWNVIQSSDLTMSELMALLLLLLSRFSRVRLCATP